MAEKSNPTNQILDVSRNMGDIVSQLKDKVSDSGKGNPGTPGSLSSITDFIDPLKSLLSDVKKSAPGVKDILPTIEAPLGKKPGDLMGWYSKRGSG